MTMRPSFWQPRVDPSAAEWAIIQRIRRAKLFVFLRHHRNALFSDAFQTELAALYVESPLGQPPIPPAQLALATILQAYTGASDDEVIEATLMDRRWHLVLDCLDVDQAPFSKGTLVAEVAQEAGAELVCGSSLKAALDRDWDQPQQKDEAFG